MIKEVQRGVAGPWFSCAGGHEWSFAHGSVFEHRTASGQPAVNVSPPEALAICWEFYRGHTLEDAIVAAGRHKDSVARIWNRFHKIAAARGQYLQGTFKFGGTRQDGTPRIVEIDETVVHTKRIPIGDPGSHERGVLLALVQGDNGGDDMNLQKAFEAADEKERAYVLAHKRIFGVCDRDDLACAFFNLPDVYVPPGSAPPLLRAAHGKDAMKQVETCGGLMCGDGCNAYVEVARNAGFEFISQVNHSKFQWTRFDCVELQTPVNLEVCHSKRNSTGSKHRFMAGNQLQESLWRPIKESIRTRQRGLQSEDLLSYFHAYIWRRVELQTCHDGFSALGALLEWGRQQAL